MEPQTSPIWKQMEALAQCINAELTNCGSPCMTLAIPGTVALWAGVDSGYVRLVNIYPTTRYPEQTDSLEGSCGEYLAATLEVGVVRCMPIPDRTVTDPNALNLAAMQMVQDMEAIRRAILCCANEDLSDAFLRQWRPMPVTGDVYGGFWTVIVSNFTDGDD